MNITEILELIFVTPGPGSKFYYENPEDWWDFETTPIASAVWVVGCLFLFGLTSLLLVLRRNYQPLKSRSPLLLWVTMTGELIIVVWACTRMVVGRSNFPCVLYVTFYCLMPPLVFAPIVLRCWRLLFVSKLASTKTLLAAQNTGTEYDSVKRRFAIIKIVISTPFLLILSLVIVLLHLIVAILLFIPDLSKLDLKGCFAGMVFMAAAALITLFWGILALASAIVAKILVREPWGIARGIGVTVLGIIPATLFWFVLNVIPGYADIIERYFPSGFFLFAALVFDVFFNSLLTIVLTFTHTAKMAKMQTEIEAHKKGLIDVLQDPESRKFLKEFAVKSFAPETVAFWEAVDNFKAVVMVKETEEVRKSTARRIISDFIDPNGPLALNLTHANEWRTALTFAIDDPPGYAKSIEMKLKQKLDMAQQQQLQQQQQDPSAQQLEFGAVPPQTTPVPQQQMPSESTLDVVLSQSLDTSLSVVMGIHAVRDEAADFSLGLSSEIPLQTTTTTTPEAGTVYTDNSTDSLSYHEEDPDSGAKKALVARPARGEDITLLRGDIFDELQHWVERDMAQDLYARFKESKFFTDMNTAIAIRREMLKSSGII